MTKIDLEEAKKLGPYICGLTPEPCETVLHLRELCKKQGKYIELLEDILNSYTGKYPWYEESEECRANIKELEEKPYDQYILASNATLTTGDLDELREVVKKYPNLDAIVAGTVSGYPTEWPAVRYELVQFIFEVARLRKLIEVHKEYIELLKPKVNIALNRLYDENEIINWLKEKIRLLSKIKELEENL